MSENETFLSVIALISYISKVIHSFYFLHPKNCVNERNIRLFALRGENKPLREATVKNDLTGIISISISHLATGYAARLPFQCSLFYSKSVHEIVTLYERSIWVTEISSRLYLECGTIRGSFDRLFSANTLSRKHCLSTPIATPYTNRAINSIGDIG